MGLNIGGFSPQPEPEQQDDQTLLPAERHPPEMTFTMGNIDPHTDMDDLGMAQRDHDFATFENLPQDEKKAVLDMVHMTEAQLLPLARQASTMLGHSRESRLAREARLHLVNKMNMKGCTVEFMAMTLGIGVRRVADLKKTLNERIKRQVSKIDFGLYAGQQIGEYEAIKHMAMTIADDKSSPMTSRMSAVVVALRAMKDQHVFLQRCGIFKQFNNGDDLIKRLQTEAAGTDGSEASLTDVAMAFKMSASMLAKADHEADIEDAELVDDENQLWVAGQVIDHTYNDGDQEV